MSKPFLSHQFALALVVVAVLSVAPAASLAASVALLPAQDRAADAAVVQAFSFVFRNEIVDRIEIVDTDLVRAGLRRLRLRDVGTAGPERLRVVAAGLGVDWLISATVHDADRRGVPRLAASARVYSGSDGEVVWSGFAAISGLDHRSVFELGREARIEALAPEVAEALVAELWDHLSAGLEDSGGATAGGEEGRVWALVPFGATTEIRALANSVVATDAANAAAFRRQLPLVSANRVRDVMRRQDDYEWGGVGRDLRLALRAECGADAILVGGVEAYEYDLVQGEPRPRVSVSLRLIDTRTGNILWSDALDRRGWESAQPFRLGRIYSRGQLIEQLLGDLMDRLIKSEYAVSGHGEGAI